MEFVVEDIGERIKIDGNDFELKKFAESFIPSFCVTVDKNQGAEIDKDYSMYDVKRMDKRQLYTSLSKATKLEHIHLDAKKLNKRYHPGEYPPLKLFNANKNQYSNGKIYKVTFNDGRIYIGSTARILSKRLKWHITQKRSQVYANRDKDPKLELIVNAPSKDITSLEAVERSYIKKGHKEHGDKQLNTKGVPTKAKKREFEVKVEKLDRNAGQKASYYRGSY